MSQAIMVAVFPLRLRYILQGLDETLKRFLASVIMTFYTYSGPCSGTAT